MKFKLLFIFLLLNCSINFGQIDFTANDTVTSYQIPFRLGVNPGYYGSNWSNETLANIAAGNSGLDVDGVGAQSFRPLLSETFLAFYGLDFEVENFQHYASLGMDENVAMIGFPSEEHQDLTNYCSGYASELFDNMYLPIWDDGLQDTPVNEENYYARFVYDLVQTYGDNIRFWEIWNEPDFDYSGNGWKPEGTEGNWFENIPQPCDYKLRAPVFHYIRMLRISYEVIKYLQPDDYVAIGGLGYPSFLDVVLRHTDEPNNGLVSTEYPLKGGAYFDVLSFHSYPHIDGSLRYWSNDIGGFVYTRHSDAAVEGFIGLKERFNTVLENYDYNGTVFPKKEWIVTESNLPRKAFDESIGSDEVQRNYLVKAQIACYKENIHQFHIYQLAEKETYDDAESSFDVMGLYKSISNFFPYDIEKTEAGIACKTLSNILENKTYDIDKTNELQMSDLINGAAFLGEDGQFIYVLWAKTQTDQTESVSAVFSFPESFNYNNVKKMNWNFSENQNSEILSAQNIELTGVPTFFEGIEISSIKNKDNSNLLLKAEPNPFSDFVSIEFFIPNKNGKVSLQLFNSEGKLVENLFKNKSMNHGSHTCRLDAKNRTAGIYFCTLSIGGKSKTLKIIQE